MKRFFIVFLMNAVCAMVHAQEVVEVVPVDSAYLARLEQIMLQLEKEEKARKIIADYEAKMMRRELSFNTTGTLQLLAGVMLTGLNRDYRKNAPHFTETSDDWRDYAVASIPGVATYMARLCGAKSRSNINRLFTSTAMSLALSAGVTSGLKNIVSERRPDWADDHSMPSRHTALAFTAATILHREYGYVSPWISVGGYTAATATQFLRLKDNAHWLNDLYVGAAIGTVSANLGYFLTDMIFGESGVAVKPKVTQTDMMRAAKFEDNPTSFCMVSGNEFGLGDELTCERTFYVGGEYSYFFNEYVAGEGILKMSSTKVNELQDNLMMYHADAALKVSCPVMPGFRLHFRTLGGGRLTERKQFIDDKSLELGCGLGFDYLHREKYAVGLTTDYYHVFSDLMPNRLAISVVYRIIL